MSNVVTFVGKKRDYTEPIGNPTDYPILKLVSEQDPLKRKTIDNAEDYIEEYFARNKGFSPSNYAIGDKVITA